MGLRKRAFLGSLVGSVIVSSIMIMQGCSKPKVVIEYENNPFSQGEIVYHKADNRRGVVTHAGHRWCYEKVTCHVSELSHSPIEEERNEVERP